MEAYYNGEKVIVRNSKPIKLAASESRQAQQKKIEWLLRWIGATPVGPTKSFENAKEFDPHTSKAKGTPKKTVTTSLPIHSKTMSPLRVFSLVAIKLDSVLFQALLNFDGSLLL